MEPLNQEFVETTRQAFSISGFLVIQDALTPAEVACLNVEVEALPLPERGALLPVADKGEALFTLADHPSILPYALALVGGNAQLLSSNVTVLPPEAGPGGWHEDGPSPFPYPAVEGRRPLLHLKFGIFLTDLAGDDRGNLVVIPGSHQIPFPRRGNRQLLWEMPGVTPLRVTPGTAVVFHNGLWHATAPNLTGRRRCVLYYTYCPAWHRIYDYVTPPLELVERIERAAPERRPMLRQLLGVVPEGGAPKYYFPDASQFPGLGLVERE